MPKPTKRSTDKRLLKVWGQFIKKRVGNRCEIQGCKSPMTKLDPHHIIGKRNRRLRYDPRNGVCLCSGHHTLGQTSAHQDPLWFIGWMLDNRLDDVHYLSEVRNEIKKWTILEMEEHLTYLKNLLDETDEY